MDLSIKGVHYHVSGTTKKFISDKMEKIWNHVSSEVTKAEITIVHDQDFRVESHLSMKWGTIVHVEECEKGLYPAIEKMVKRLDHCLIQEKEKHHVTHSR